MIFPKDTKIKIFTCICLMATAVFVFPHIQTTHADDSSTAALQAQEKNLQSQLNQINTQINSYQNSIAQAQSKVNTMSNEIDIYDDEIATTQLQIQAQQTQIDNTNLQITEVQKLITQQQQQIDSNKQVLGQLIEQLNEYDNEYTLQTTLGSKNLSDFLDTIQYTSTYGDQISQLVNKIQALKQQLEQQQQSLQANLTQLQQLEQNLQQTQDSLSEQKTQQQQLLAQTQGSEHNYQKLLAGSQSDKADLQKEVDDLDNQVKAKLGNKAEPSGKGDLAWPVDGIVTQGYGNTGFTSLGYNFHNGLDIAGPAGSPVYAAADGVIYDIDHSNAEYGNWVAIKHPSLGIVTLYGHMRTIIVAPGQSVKQGDLIGYEGNTGNTTRLLYGPEHGYHVHFGVYDIDGFAVNAGAYPKVYGPYKIPYGATYNPYDFLASQ